MSECGCITDASGNPEECFVCVKKTCDNCGRRKECDSDNGLWRCNNHSAWKPKEIKPDIHSAIMEIDRLKAKLATIERDTAEKCAEIIGHVSDGSSAMDEFCQVSDLQESILNHFNLVEKP